MRSLREARDLSQEDLAELLGWDRKVVNRLETGWRVMTIDQAAYIAKALNVPVAWLFSDAWTTLSGASAREDRSQ